MAIFEIGWEEIQQGVLAAAFTRGAVACMLRSDGGLRRLWSRLLENREEKLPWEAPLIDIARNHHGSHDIATSLGDVYYFQPGHHGYIARKVEIDRSPDDGRVDVRPEAFHQGDERYALPSETIAECCRLTDRIALGMTPAGETVRKYKVAVQRLKYQNSSTEFGRLADLTAHSLGRWGRVGYTIDCNRERLSGPLSAKGPADLMGMLMLVPGLRGVTSGLNRLAGHFDQRRQTEPGDEIIEGPHYDSRLFTALCGLRDNIRTEIYVDGRWEKLPVDLDSIAVFPGDLARRSYGLQPTMHRVLQHGDAGGADARTGNVTLLLGAS